MNKVHITVILSLALILVVGCQSTSNDPQNTQSTDSPFANPDNTGGSKKNPFKSDENFAQVKVFFATDRALTGSSDPTEMFGGDRGDFQYGSAIISIPRDHKMGELEEPSILRLEFSSDPEKHVTLMSVDVTKKSRFLNELRSRVNSSEDKQAFIYIHGYNNSFEYVARRTAQMTYDLAFDGAPIFYSWPSQATFEGYPVDETNVQWTLPHLKSFLKDVAEQSQAESVYLIAHSMGNRALTRAFVELAREPNSEFLSVYKEIILTAPDIDSDIFRRDLAPELVASGANVTLYASAEDKALIASKSFHGYPRAGDTGDEIVIVDNMETIDATKVQTDFLGHAYFAESKSIIADLFALLHKKFRADERKGLRPRQSPAGTYWEVIGEEN